jgi:hypothetical protein
MRCPWRRVFGSKATPSAYCLKAENVGTVEGLSKVGLVVLGALPQVLAAVLELAQRSEAVQINTEFAQLLCQELSALVYGFGTLTFGVGAPRSGGNHLAFLIAPAQPGVVPPLQARDQTLPVQLWHDVA